MKRTQCTDFYASLLTTLHKNTNREMKIYGNFTTDVSVDEKGLIKFCKSYASGSISKNFLQNSSSLQDRAFIYNLI